MYSDKKNILQLVALLKAHGVRKIVLCPGSRNAAIVHTLANIEDFTCYSVTDERSAGFFAIGQQQERTLLQSQRALARGQVGHGFVGFLNIHLHVQTPQCPLRLVTCIKSGGVWLMCVTPL